MWQSSCSIPHRYFVGKLKSVERGSKYRIFRHRKNRLFSFVDEVLTREGWRRMKSGFTKVGIFMLSRDAARAEKWSLEGRV